MSAQHTGRGLARPREGLTGEVMLLTSPGHNLLAGVAIVATVALLLLGATAQYTRRERLQGWVVPDGGLIRVAAREAGFVDKVLAREGAEVAAGAPLALIQRSVATAAGDSGAAMTRDVDAEALAVRLGADATLGRLVAEATQDAERAEGLRRELVERRMRLEIAEQKLAVARTAYARREQLAKDGFISSAGLENQRMTVLSAEGERTERRSDVLQVERGLTDLRAATAIRQRQADAARAAADRDAAQLRQQKTNAESGRSILVTAPLAGRVVAIPVDLGQTLSQNDAVAVLVPRQSHLIAELYAPSRNIGFLRVGQPVRLMYQAFPHEIYGAGEGRVIAVSRTVLNPQEVKTPGIDPKEPVFRVRVALARDWIDAKGQPVRLQPGMLLSADVMTARGTMLDWLRARSPA